MENRIHGPLPFSERSSIDKAFFAVLDSRWPTRPCDSGGRSRARAARCGAAQTSWQISARKRICRAPQRHSQQTPAATSVCGGFEAGFGMAFGPQSGALFLIYLAVSVWTEVDTHG